MAKAPAEKTKVVVKTSTRMSKKGPLTPDILRKIDAYWRAANYLAAGQLYLQDNPLLRHPLCPADVKPTPVGHWGNRAGTELYLHPPQPGDHQVRPEHDLRVRARPRRQRGGGPGLPGRGLQRVLPQRQPGRGGYAQAVPPILLPRRHRQPLRPQHPRLHQRRGANWATLWPCLRRGDGQPHPHRRLRGGGRRGGNRPPGHRLALQQVSQSGGRRRGAAPFSI